MAKDRSLVRASDLASWSYCNRAWWLAQVQGAEHENPDMLAHGDAAHRTHGRTVATSGWLALAGTSLALIGLAGLTLALLWQLFG